MDINKNTDCDYYIKELVDNFENKYNVFYVNKNVPTNEKMLKEMEKYNFFYFQRDFNQSKKLYFQSSYENSN